MDYYAQGSLVAAIVALAIAGYLRVWARNDREALAFADLSLVIFLWCSQSLWKTLGSSFGTASPSPGSCSSRPSPSGTAGPPWTARNGSEPPDLEGCGSARFSSNVFSERLLASPWWNKGGPPLRLSLPGLCLHIVVRHGFRANPSSVEERSSSSFWWEGIASLVAPLNFLPGTGVYFPPLAAFAVLLFFYFMATGILHLHFFEFPDIVGRGIILVIQVFAFAVIFGALEVASGRKFWFPLAGVFLISFFLLTFYPVLMRKLGGISSDLLVRESRAVQARLGDLAKRLSECSSLSEIALTVEEGLAQIPFVTGTPSGSAGGPTRIRTARAPGRISRAFHRFSRRFPPCASGARRVPGGGRGHLGRHVGRLLRFFSEAR